MPVCGLQDGTCGCGQGAARACEGRQISKARVRTGGGWATEGEEIPARGTGTLTGTTATKRSSPSEKAHLQAAKCAHGAPGLSVFRPGAGVGDLDEDITKGTKLCQRVGHIGQRSGVKASAVFCCADFSLRADGGGGGGNGGLVT